MTELPTCGIVGPGRVGKALALAFHDRGCLRFVKGRSPEHALWAYAHGLPYSESWETLPPVDVVWFTVPDRALSSVLAECLSRVAPALRARASFVHTAGSLGGEPFHPWADTILWGCAHPCQTFPQEPQRNRLRCIGWLIESPWARTQHQLATLVRALDGIPLTFAYLDPQRRARYHAAAVLASNALMTSLRAAFDLVRSADLPAQLLLQPLASTALATALAAPTDPVRLTGPIARGDWPTVERHLRALPPPEAALYRYLSAAIATLAHQHGFLSTEQYQHLLNLLGLPPPGDGGS